VSVVPVKHRRPQNQDQSKLATYFLVTQGQAIYKKDGGKAKAGGVAVEMSKRSNALLYLKKAV